MTKFSFYGKLRKGILNMNMVLDFLANFSVIIIIFICVVDEKIFKNSSIPNIIIMAPAILFPILVIFKYGNIFFVILNGILYFLLFILLLYIIISDTESWKDLDLKDSFNFLLILAICIADVYGIYSRIEFEREYLENMFNKLKSMNYKEIFMKMINNDWFQGICIGVISTVVGGIILNKIISNKIKNKDESEKNDDKIEEEQER